jgi:hypothetical protein
MSFWKWSRTAANNATADGSINWAEGQAPSTVDDSARAMMPAASKYRDDVAGAIATAGSASAYTLSSFQVFDTLAHMDGAMGTAQMPSHSHGVSDPTHAHGVSDPSHSHGVSDPTHAHSVAFSTAATTNGSISPFAFVDGVGAGANITATAAAATNISIPAATTGISLGAAATGIAIQAAGGGAAHQNMPPTRILQLHHADFVAVATHSAHSRAR